LTPNILSHKFSLSRAFICFEIKFIRCCYDNELRAARGIDAKNKDEHLGRDRDKTLLIARPRGFCAGVERAIDVVERLLRDVGTPLCVRKEIVHNRSVVEDFRRRGVVFVDRLDQVPEGGIVVFSAHGVSPEVIQEAVSRRLQVIDATCPLVTKVHREVVRLAETGHHIVLIGHAGHDEVLGTMGEAPAAITLVTRVEDVAGIAVPDGSPVAYVTQTTLSVDETRDIVAALKMRFPALQAPSQSDICYATQNRQDAVKQLVSLGIQSLIVVGSANSSNSQRLVEVARKMGATATLVDGPEDLRVDDLASLDCIGLTAGASAPEHLVQAVAQHLQSRGWLIREVGSLEEEVKFQLPKELSRFSNE
jgi:4-hydroxy-3-methylbut-2-enyl diphosphate reductase